MMFMLKSPFLQVKSPFSTAFHRDFPSEAQIFLHRQLATEHPAQGAAQHRELLPRGVRVLRAQPLVRDEENEHAWDDRSHQKMVF